MIESLAWCTEIFCCNFRKKRDSSPLLLLFGCLCLLNMLIVDCCLYVLFVFIDIEMVFLYLAIYFCLSRYLTLTNVPNFSQFQIPALIVVIYLCDSIWYFLGKWVRAGFLSLFYMYCRWRSSYQEGSVVIPLTVLSPPNFCDCPKPGPGFPMSYLVDCLVLSEFNWLERFCLSSFCLILVELITIIV